MMKRDDMRRCDEGRCEQVSMLRVKWLVACVVALSCADKPPRSGNMAGSEAEVGVAGEGGSEPSGGASGGGAGSGGSSAGSNSGGVSEQNPTAIRFDSGDCAARPVSECEAVRELYGSNGAFDGTPSLAHCSEFSSFDGCGQLVFSFDDGGCVSSVSPGPEGWAASEHLVELRDCLRDALQTARWPCRASGTLTFEESCRTR